MYNTPDYPEVRPLRVLFPLFILIGAFIVVSCNSTSKQPNDSIPVINIEPAIGNARIVDLSEIAEDIEYIPLETVPNSLLKDLSNIRFEDDKFFIGLFDNKVFSRSGRYLWTFDKSGRGPGEYTFSQGISKERGTGNFIVNTLSNKNISLYIYDSTGIFIQEKTFPFPYSDKLGTPILLENDYLLASAPQASKTRVDFWALVMDNKYNVISKMAPPYDIGDKGIATGHLVISSTGDANREVPVSVINSYPSIYTGANLIRLYSPVVDTIYTIDSDYRFIPVLRINHGKIPSSRDKPDNTRGYGYGKYISLLPKEYKEWNKYLLMAWLMNDYATEPKIETLNIRGSGSTRKNTTTYGLYNKETGDFTFMKKPIEDVYGFRDNIAGGPPFIPTYISHDGKYAVSLIPTSKIEQYLNSNPADSRFAEIAKKVAFDDNPVVVLVTLR